MEVALSFETSLASARPKSAPGNRPGKPGDTQPAVGGSLSSHDRARLRQTPLLSALPPEAFELLLPAIDILAPGRDALLFAQGERADSLHIILDGRVALLGSTPDHRACILEIFSAREGLVDPSALIDQPHPVSARTIEASRIARLPMRALNAALEGEAGLSRSLAALLAQHWRLFLRRLEDQKLRSAPQRLAAYLSECAEAGAGNGAADGPIRFILSEDRRTLASHLGMTPENLSRVIGQLRPLGVTLNGRAVSIGDLAGLRQFGCAARQP